MTTLTLAKLAEIEAAAEKSKSSIDPERWWLAPDLYEFVSKRDAAYIALCDPATVAALCRVARAAVEMNDQFSITHNLSDAIRAAGLLE